MTRGHVTHLLSVENSDGRIFLILANSSGHSLGAKVAAIVKFRRNRRSSILQPEQSVSPLQVPRSPVAAPIFTNPTFTPSSDTMQTQQTRTPAEHPPNRANLRAWWSHFHFAQKTKKEGLGGPHRRTSASAFLSAFLLIIWLSTRHRGSPCLRKVIEGESQICQCPNIHCRRQWQSLCMGLYPRSRCQMVSIHTLLIDDSDTRISGLYLKENGASYPNPWSRGLNNSCFAATEVQGTFRVNGSTKRMRELQAAFESPPRVRFLSIPSFTISNISSSTERTSIGDRNITLLMTSRASFADTLLRCQ